MGFPKTTATGPITMNVSNRAIGALIHSPMDASLSFLEIRFSTSANYAVLFRSRMTCRCSAPSVNRMLLGLKLY